MFKGKQLQVTYIANLMKELDPTAPSALNLTNGIEELSDKESELVVGGIGTVAGGTRVRVGTSTLMLDFDTA